MSSVCINLALLGCIMSLLGFLLSLYLRGRMLRIICLAVLGLTVAADLVAILLRWVMAGHPPLVSGYETLILLGLTILASVFVLELVRPTRGVAVMGTLLGLLTLGAASFRADPDIKPLVPALQSNWLIVHVLSYLIGYGALTVGFGISVIVLSSWVLRRLGRSEAFPTENLAKLGHGVVGFAFPFLTLGLVTGSIWARTAWGSYWSWDPKETWSLVTWLLYLSYFHLAPAFPKLVAQAGKPRRGSSLLCLAQVIIFLVLIFTFLGLRYLPSVSPSLHLY